jgi:hypothetical protein
MTGANPSAAVPDCPHFQEFLFCEQGRGGKAVEIEDVADRAAAVTKISLDRHIASIKAERDLAGRHTAKPCINRPNA